MATGDGGNGTYSPEQFAAWLDKELATDKSQATADAVIKDFHSWRSVDMGAYDLHVVPVLERHGVLAAVEECLSRAMGEAPPTPPAPSDHDRVRNDPRAKGGPLDPEDDLSFRVSRIRKVETKPPKWFVQIDGSEELELETDQFMSPALFKRVFMETLNRMPMGLPKSVVWQELIARWLTESLVVEEVGDERSDNDTIRIVTEEVLADIAVGDDTSDMWRRHCFPVEDDEGKMMVRQATVRVIVEERTRMTVSSKQMALILRALGALPVRRRLPGRANPVALWVFPREREAPLAEEGELFPQETRH